MWRRSVKAPAGDGRLRQVPVELAQHIPGVQRSPGVGVKRNARSRNASSDFRSQWARRLAWAAGDSAMVRRLDADFGGRRRSRPSYRCSVPVTATVPSASGPPRHTAGPRFRRAASQCRPLARTATPACRRGPGPRALGPPPPAADEAASGHSERGGPASQRSYRSIPDARHPRARFGGRHGCIGPSAGRDLHRSSTR